MDPLHTIQMIALWAVPVVFAITLHEVAHGVVALWFGDKTAYLLGRLTINPFKHIDLVGTIIVPALLLTFTNFIFGWAKPVPVDQRNLKHPKRDMAIVAAAGPLSNLLMAIFWAIVLKVGIYMQASHMAIGPNIITMGQAGIMINLVLGVLNLIPIPPLDGSRVVASFLPSRAYYLYNKIEPYGFFILLALVVFNIFQIIVGPPVYYLHDLLLSLVGLK